MLYSGRETIQIDVLLYLPNPGASPCFPQPKAKQLVEYLYPKVEWVPICMLDELKIVEDFIVSNYHKPSFWSSAGHQGS